MLTAALMLSAGAVFALPAGLGGVLAQAPTFTPREEKPEDYPDGPGRDAAFYACTGCHDFTVVAQQAQSRQQWEDTLEWMTTRHNMPRIEGDLRKNVLDYLEATYPPRRRSPGGWQNPFPPR